MGAGCQGQHRWAQSSTHYSMHRSAILSRRYLHRRRLVMCFMDLKRQCCLNKFSYIFLCILHLLYSPKSKNYRCIVDVQMCSDGTYAHVQWWHFTLAHTWDFQCSPIRVRAIVHRLHVSSHHASMIIHSRMLPNNSDGCISLSTVLPLVVFITAIPSCLNRFITWTSNAQFKLCNYTIDISITEVELYFTVATRWGSNTSH